MSELVTTIMTLEWNSVSAASRRDDEDSMIKAVAEETDASVVAHCPGLVLGWSDVSAAYRPGDVVWLTDMQVTSDNAFEFWGVIRQAGGSGPWEWQVWERVRVNKDVTRIICSRMGDDLDCAKLSATLVIAAVMS